MKKFPFQSWFVGQKKSIRFGRPFSGCAPSRAGCIQTGFPCQKTCIACNCAVQLRNWGTSHSDQSHSARAPHRKHNARLNADPASRECEDRTSPASSVEGGHCGLRHRSPCSPVVYISCPFQNLFIVFESGFAESNYSHHRTIAGQASASLSRFGEDAIPMRHGACLPVRKQQRRYHLF